VYKGTKRFQPGLKRVLNEILELRPQKKREKAAV
jgi:hypothetical protein